MMGMSFLSQSAVSWWIGSWHQYISSESFLEDFAQYHEYGKDAVRSEAQAKP